MIKVASVNRPQRTCAKSREHKRRTGRQLGIGGRNMLSGVRAGKQFQGFCHVEYWGAEKPDRGVQVGLTRAGRRDRTSRSGRTRSMVTVPCR